MKELIRISGYQDRIRNRERWFGRMYFITTVNIICDYALRQIQIPNQDSGRHPNNLIRNFRGAIL
jgi:hypothetical protein